MNWKNSTLYWIRLWRKWTFCLRTALSITAGILQSEQGKKKTNKHLVISLIKTKTVQHGGYTSKSPKNSQQTSHRPWFPLSLAFEFLTSFRSRAVWCLQNLFPFYKRQATYFCPHQLFCLCPWHQDVRKRACKRSTTSSAFYRTSWQRQ